MSKKGVEKVSKRYRKGVEKVFLGRLLTKAGEAMDTLWVEMHEGQTKLETDNLSAHNSVSEATPNPRHLQRHFFVRPFLEDTCFDSFLTKRRFSSKCNKTPKRHLET